MSTVEQICAEAEESFVSAYKTYLYDRLREAAQEGYLESIIQFDMIDSNTLTSADEWSYSQVSSEYAWRIGSDTLNEYFIERGHDVYDAIDYDALIAEARSL